MSTDIKNKEKEQGKETGIKLITDYLDKTQKAPKRPSSILSPPDFTQQSKKQITRITKMPVGQSTNDEAGIKCSNMENETSTTTAVPDTIKDAIAPIISEIQLLQESVHSDFKKLHTDYLELKESISTKLNEVVEKLNSKIDINTEKVSQMINENKQLCKENISLRERIMKIESDQVKNNIIISGIPESKWEPYETTVA